MGVKAKEWKNGWWVFVNHQGKRKAIKCANKKSAETVATKLDAKLKLGGVLDDERPDTQPAALTFREYAERWLIASAPRVKGSSLAEYTRRLHLRLIPALGDLALTAITRETVRTLAGKLIVDTTRDNHTTKQTVSRATARETLRTLGMILSTAVEDGLIPANPATRLGKVMGSKDPNPSLSKEIEVFSREELKAILVVAEHDYPEWFPFILCLARTGLRFGEALALEWSDVDFRNRVLLVRRSIREGVVSTTKNRNNRRVDMSAQLASALEGLKSCQEAEAVVNGAATPERVFTAFSGSKRQDGNFRDQHWRGILRRAEVRYRKPHTLRHTFASLLIEAGEPLPYIQTQLGHHSPAFTLKVYGHLIPRGERRAVDVLDDVAAQPDATPAQPAAVTAGKI